MGHLHTLPNGNAVIAETVTSVEVRKSGERDCTYEVWVRCFDGVELVADGAPSASRASEISRAVTAAINAAAKWHDDQEPPEVSNHVEMPF